MSWAYFKLRIVSPRGRWRKDARVVWRLLSRGDWLCCVCTALRNVIKIPFHLIPGQLEDHQSILVRSIAVFGTVLVFQG